MSQSEAAWQGLPSSMFPKCCMFGDLQRYPELEVQSPLVLAAVSLGLAGASVQLLGLKAFCFLRGQKAHTVSRFCCCPLFQTRHVCLAKVGVAVQLHRGFLASKCAGAENLWFLNMISGRLQPALFAFATYWQQLAQLLCLQQTVRHGFRLQLLRLLASSRSLANSWACLWPPSLGATWPMWQT